jgi:site-specific DNA-methyltransferase (adenine-specific)
MMIKLGKAELHNADCMELMAQYPDGYFELAIVDPPYGIGGDSLHSNRALNRALKGAGKLKNRALNTGNTKWDIAPNNDYFSELKRVSKNQIIWGGNYFDMPKSRGVICWDKCQPWPNFSAWEMAWTSFDCVARIFRFDNRTSDKIHPTQKPISLYEWLLTNYAKPNDKILDTHLGSMSSVIACHNLGFEIVGSELDKDYFDAGIARVKQAMAQERLFD